MITNTSSTIKEKQYIHNNFWYILFFLLILAYQYSDFNSSRNVLWREFEGGNRGNVHILLFSAILFSGIYFIFSKTKDLRNNRILFFIFLLCLWSLFVEYVSGGSFWIICIYCGLSLLWIFIFIVGYDIALQWEKSKKITLLFMYIAFGLTAYYFYISYSNRVNTIGEGGVFNIAYNLLAFIPFFLLDANKKINVFLLVFTTVLITMTVKRGAIISVFLMGFTYLFLKNDMHKNIGKAFMLLFVFAFFLSITVYFINVYSEGLISERFSAEEIQSGSGRDTQYSSAFRTWSNAGILNMLFGFGSTNFQSSFGIAIHNEFLSWLCYYGVIGFFLFSMFMFCMLKNQLELQKKMSPYSAIHVTILCYFFVASLVSGFFFMHMTMYHMLTLGIIAGLESRRKHSDASMPPEENLAATQAGVQPEIPASHL